MQTEPPKADPPKRKRRWFQFSLRSLMIGVTLLAVVCGYFGCRAKIIRHWTALLNVFFPLTPFGNPNPPAPNQMGGQGKEPQQPIDL